MVACNLAKNALPERYMLPINWHYYLLSSDFKRGSVGSLALEASADKIGIRSLWWMMFTCKSNPSEERKKGVRAIFGDLPLVWAKPGMFLASVASVAFLMKSQGGL